MNAEHRHGTSLTLICDQCNTSWRYSEDAPKQCPECLDHLGELIDPAPGTEAPVAFDRGNRVPRCTATHPVLGRCVWVDGLEPHTGESGRAWVGDYR